MKSFLFVCFLFSTTAMASYVSAPYEVNRGGSGDSSTTAYGVLAGGTTSTSAFQNVGTGTSGQVLTSAGSSALATWATPTVYADKALDNLASVAINTSLLPATAGSANIGSNALPFGTDFEQALELLGSSSGNVQIKAGSTVSNWTITLPSAVCSNGQYWADNGSGVYSCTSPVAVTLTVVNGGNTSYAIQAADGHIRSGTALTAQRTYTLDACTSNIGERHEIKNVQSQTFNLIVAGNGGDTVDGSGTYTLYPGDALSVICAVSGYWDIE